MSADDCVDLTKGVYAGFAAGAIVAPGTCGGTYRQTGKSFTAPFAHVWKFRDGKVVSFEQLTDTAVHLRPLQ